MRHVLLKVAKIHFEETEPKKVQVRKPEGFLQIQIASNKWQIGTSATSHNREYTGSNQTTKPVLSDLIIFFFPVYKIECAIYWTEITFCLVSYTFFHRLDANESFSLFFSKAIWCRYLLHKNLKTPDSVT